MPGPLINLDAPSIPEGWKILDDDRQVQSRMKGMWTYDPSKLCDHLDFEQVRSKRGFMEGRFLRPKLEGQPVGRAAIAEMMFAKQLTIPRSWKDGRAHVFWGDNFWAPNNNQYVRGIIWGGFEWSLNWYDSLYDRFNAHHPAVCAREP